MTDVTLDAFTDIVIRRAKNGFIVYTSSLHDDSSFDTYVYEFENPENQSSAEFHAFRRLILDHFPMMLQSKRTGGIVVSVHDKGYSDES